MLGNVNRYCYLHGYAKKPIYVYAKEGLQEPKFKSLLESYHFTTDRYTYSIIGIHHLRNINE